MATALDDERVQVGVLGGGAFGTAMAIHCARKGHAVTLWALEQEVVDSLNGPERENLMYFKGHKAPPGLRATRVMQEAVRGSAMILAVIPTQFVGRTMLQVAQELQPDQIVVSCSKGITTDTLETVDEVLKRVLPPAIRSCLAFLSGPSFAAEVAAELPSAVTIASHDECTASRAQQLLSTPRFRCYRTADVEGVELCGALKNVLAIGCGISDGLQFGNNGRAALITRGTYEITKLAVAKGGNPLTMSGLAGMGDIVLTCTGDLSRNRTVGLRLGRGEKLEAVQASMNAVAEGVPTARAAYALACKLGVECPVLEGIFRVIHEGADPASVVLEAMSRDLKPEVEPAVMAAAAAMRTRL
ncbi:NAD-dependent glycerol-3-phosphate dehydrogenase [Haematococcus lacustris]